jgi:SOS-response transcriptional repressor LexA
MPASKKATKQQLETLEHIRQYVAKHGYSPTLAELASSGAVAQNCIAERLGALVKLGLITKTPGIARSIRPAH